MRDRIEYPLTASVLAVLREEAAVSGATGRWDDRTAGFALTHGGCALFAAALAVAHGLPVAGVGQTECCAGVPSGEHGPCCGFGDCAAYGDGRCCCHAHHFYVAVDGWCVDVYGEHDPSGVLEVYPAMYAWSDRALACLLETWHRYVAEDADLVLLALDLAARPFAEVRFGLGELEVGAVV